MQDGLENSEKPNFGAKLLFAGSSIILISFILYHIIGINLDTAIAKNDFAGYLDRSHDMHTFLVIQVSLGMIGFFIISMGLNTVARSLIGNKNISNFSTHIVYIASTLIFISGFGLIAINTKLISAQVAEHALIFQMFGWFVSRIFWISIVFLLGFIPYLISIYSDKSSFAKWHRILGMTAGFTSILTILSFLTHALGTYGSWLFPVGMLWIISSAFQLRKSR
jgi:hypothetical protein